MSRLLNLSIIIGSLFGTVISTNLYTHAASGSANPSEGNKPVRKSPQQVEEDLNKEFQTYLKDPNDKNAVNLQQEINTVKGIDAESSSES